MDCLARSTTSWRPSPLCKPPPSTSSPTSRSWPNWTASKPRCGRCPVWSTA
ncbi:hypothetical protein [Mycolicibacterium obuense]|uniref:hypothetical protein n=1 Tax=Mycolicibacterium monacense TaxID=85693 RepID=UPI001CED786F